MTVMLTVMTPRKVYLNNYVKNDAVYVDRVSKMYIYTVWFLGLQRYMILDIKLAYLVLGFVYVACVLSAVTYAFLNFFTFVPVMAEVKEFQYFFCVIVSTGLWKRMRRYYNELTKFDNAVGCRPKTTTTSILVLVQMSLISVLFVATPIYFRVVQFIPLHLVYVSETHYFGHLFSLLSPRIRLLSFYVESTLTNWKKSSRAEDKEFVFFSKTKRHRIKFDDLMDLYCTLVDAHDHLMDAIKWQVAVMLITSFIYLLVACWLVANYLVSNHKLVLEIALINTSLTIAELLSLLAMCLCADKARAEVRRFRELLASTLYEGQLDKSSRSSARTILTLTETRNLSFRLLRMVDMSISLPFSFLGLLVTYLIILIQFEKVIAP